MLWYLVKSEGHILNRVSAIAIIVGYGVVLVYLIPALMGWPILTKNMPDKTQIATYIVKEPRDGNRGFIYFWTILEEQDPRSYKVDYSRELHKKLIEAGKRRGKGSRLVVDNVGKGKGKNKSKGNQDNSGDSINFKIIHPRATVRK